MYSTPQGLSLTFDKLKDIARVLLNLIPDLNTTLPCYLSHQNVEGAMYCGECNPNGPDFDLTYLWHIPTKVTLVFGEHIIKDKTQYNGKDARNVTYCIRLTVQTKDRQFNTTLCLQSR